MIHQEPRDQGWLAREGLHFRKICLANMDCNLDREQGRGWDLGSQPGQAQGHWAQDGRADVFRWDAPRVLVSYWAEDCEK